MPRIVAVVLALLGSLAGQSASGAALIEYSLQADSFSGGGQSVFHQVPLGPNLSDSLSNGGSQVELLVQGNVIRARAQTSWAPGEGQQHAASVNVLLFDTIMLPGTPGTFVNASFSYQTSGLVAQSNGDARWLTEMSLTGPFSQQGFFLIQAQADGRDSRRFGLLGSSLPVTVVSAPAPGATALFPVGVPIELRLRLFIQADGSDSLLASGGSAEANFLSTVVPLGVTFTDASGNPISGLQLLSDSGIDWLNPAVPVPQPATIWLLLAGLGGLGARARIQARSGRLR